MRFFLLLSAILFVSNASFACGYTASEKVMEKYRKSMIHAHENICVGRDEAELKKLEKQFEIVCERSKRSRDEFLKKYKGVKGQQYAEDLRMHEWLVQLECDFKDKLDKLCAQNYRMAVECGFLEADGYGADIGSGSTNRSLMK